MEQIIKIIFLVVLFLSLLSAQSQVAAPLVTDRPDQTESPLTVPENSFQVECGFVFASAREEGEEGTLKSESFEIGSTLLRYGLFSEFELRLSGGYLSEKIRSETSGSDDDGIAGITVGMKYHLATEQNLVPETALIITATLPLGNQDLISKRVLPGFIFVAGYTLSDLFALSFNLGGLWSDEYPFVLRFSSALGIGLSERTGAFIELFGLNPSNADGILSIDTGVTYLVLPNLQIDASCGLSLTGKPAEWFISTGFSWRLPN